LLKLFNNRLLSEKLQINLAKWKRWSREFLPPDPLGGLQSGYTREYNPDDAFKVFLGGFLVTELKYSIPDTKQILQDLGNWMMDNGFEYESGGDGGLSKKENPGINNFVILMVKNENGTFSYTIRGIVSTISVFDGENHTKNERYIEKPIGCVDNIPVTMESYKIKIINISKVLEVFVRRLDLSFKHYGALTQTEK